MHILARDAQHVLCPGRVGDDVTVREHRPLRHAGRARRVADGEEIVCVRGAVGLRLGLPRRCKLLEAHDVEACSRGHGSEGLVPRGTEHYHKSQVGAAVPAARGV